MPKVIKCPSCNYFYDGDKFSKCPYCKSESNEVLVDIKAADPSKDAEKMPVQVEKEEDIKPIVTPIVSKEDNGNSTVGVYGNNQINSEPAGFQRTVGRYISSNKAESIQTVDEPVKEVHNDTPTNTTTQNDIIAQSRKTVGVFVSKNSNEEEYIYPVVGWLVCVKGSYEGQSFNLKAGKNKIGRSVEMDVKLLNEASVSRKSQAVIIYDSVGNEFNILPGESDTLVYVNNAALYERKVLHNYDEIQFGDTGLNKYVFISFCNDQFTWKQVKEGE